MTTSTRARPDVEHDVSLTAPPPSPGRPDRPLSDRPESPRWARPGLVALLLGTGVLYLWGLSANGYANDFYAAAVQAGSQSWKAFFFGSLDAGNSITVDKTPGFLWIMELSVRMFGLNSWALLVPQALMGVGTVALVVASVRRTLGRPGAALLAGAVMALTPVAVVMFRFDNPDALLVLLLTAAAYALTRAVEGRRAARWIMLAGALIGFAFLAKMMQAFLVLPGFALVYLLLAPVALRRRLLHLLAAGAAMIAAAGWWIAIVQLWPAASRPYIGGSTNNSILELALGYNGLSRISGSTGGPQTGTPGVLRLFGVELGGEVAWFLPAALVALVVGLIYTARRPRTDRVRAGLAIWGGWLLITGAVFSLMAGIFHGYYTVALAPAIAALVGIGAGLLWERRDSMLASGILAGTVALTGAWSFVLLSRASDYLPTLRWVVLVASLLAAGGLALGSRVGTSVRRVVVAVAIAATLAGPAAWSVQTATTAHTGSMPTAGPALTAGAGTQGFGGPPGGGTPPTGAGQAPTGTPAARGTGGTNAGGGGSASTQVEALIAKNAGSYTWAAATTGSQTAAGYQLATGDAVMAIGGFNGGDNSPTLAQFQADVAAGKVHYYIAGGQGGGQGGGTGSPAQIATWVASHFTAQTVDGVTVYDLTS